VFVVSAAPDAEHIYICLGGGVDKPVVVVISNRACEEGCRYPVGAFDVNRSAVNLKFKSSSGFV